MTPQRESETVRVELTREEAEALFLAQLPFLNDVDHYRLAPAWDSTLDKLRAALNQGSAND